jgi:hypothetical protein
MNVCGADCNSQLLFVSVVLVVVVAAVVAVGFAVSDP